MGGNISGRLLGFIVSVILARLLVPSDFGLLVTIQILTGALGFVASGGMGEALVQSKEVNEQDFNTVFTLQLVVCVLIYLVLYIIAPWFSAFFGNELYIELLRVSAISFLLRPIQNYHRSRLRREMRFKETTIVSMLTLIGTSSCSITLAYFKFGVWSLVLGGIFGGLVNSLLFKYMTGKSPNIYLCKHSSRRLGGYGIKFSIIDIIIHFRNQTANLLLSRLSGPSYVGLYNKADSLSTLPFQTISGTTYQTVFTALSKEQDNLDKSKYIYYRTITLVTVYAMPFYIGLLWLAEPFIQTVYGSKWIEAALPLQILATTGLFMCISNASGAVVAAQNQLGHEIRIQIESWIILTIGCLIGIKWGIAGVAVGIIPSKIYLAIRMNWLANKCILGKLSDLVRSLTPAATINGGLMLVLGLTHITIPENYVTLHPAIYLATMSAVGGLFYGLVFLYAPIEALSAEAMRWKRKLKLA